MKISYGTDVGMVRKENQDSLFVHRFSGTDGLFIVADGMGGYEGGKLASGKAVELISDKIISSFTNKLNKNQILELLQTSIKEASRQIYKLSSEKRELRGMGTTVVACILTDNNLYTASVGDSRCYVLGGNSLKQITRDHSLVYDLLSRGIITKEEAMVHPQKNVITRAVGSEEIVLTDTFVTKLTDDDVVLLCSDGLHGMVSEEDIKKVIQKNDENSAEQLIALANENGGKDNITVITVRITDEVK